MSIAKQLVKLFYDNREAWTLQECQDMLIRAFNDSKKNGDPQGIFTQADHDWALLQLDEIF